MSETITCPVCGRRLTLAAEVLGRSVVCPSCAQQFVADRKPPLGAGASLDAGAPIGAFQELDEFVSPDGADAEPEPARRRPPPSRSIRNTPRPRRARTGLWVAAITLGGILGFGGIGKMLMQRPAPPAWVPPVAAPEQREEVREAFVQPKPLADKEAAAQLQALFAALADASQKRQAERVAQQFDFERMLEELVTLGVLPPALRNNRAAFVVGMSNGFKLNVQRMPDPLFGWTATDIKSVKQLAANEAVVIARHRLPIGGTLKMRWWVIRQGITWRVYDFEDLDAGLRASTISGSLVAMGPVNAQGINQAALHLREAITILHVQRDPDAAEAKLRLVQGVALPKPMEALRLFVSATIQLQRGQFQESLATCEKIEHLQPDMPALDLIRASNHTRLGACDKALGCLEAYEALLGDDANVCYERGEAMRGLQRWPEAKASFRKALDYEPKHFDAFLSLMQSLTPGDERDDLGPRFLQLDRPHENFPKLAEDCRQNRDGESLVPIAQAMLKLDPKLPIAEFYLGLAQAWQQKDSEALALFKSAYAKEPNPARRQDYMAWFVPVIAVTGKALDVYAAVPDPPAVFRALARELKLSMRTDELKKLLAVHEKKHAADPLVALYRAELHYQEGDYAQAEAAFRTAWSKAPDQQTRNEFRPSRVLARYYLDQTLAAYAEVGPPRETFQQLAYLCFQDQRWTELRALLDAHAKADAHDPLLLRFGFRVKIQSGQVADGITAFQAAMTKLPQDAERTMATNEFALDMCRLGKSQEAYAAAPDARQAFAALSGQLFDNLQRDELLRLIAAHRAKHADDPMLALMEGGQLIQDKAWAKAANILGAALKSAPPELRFRFRQHYTLALYKSGKWREAYQQADDRPSTFSQLANLMQHDKKADDWEALVQLHRPQPDGDAEALFQRARIKVLQERFEEAHGLIGKACTAAANPFVRQGYMTAYLQDMLKAGKSLEGYRALPDAGFALKSLAPLLIHEKKPALLEALVSEHGKGHPKDPWLSYYQAQLHLMRGEGTQASAILTAALAEAPADARFTFRQEWLRARVAAGQAASAWHENGGGYGAFQELAQSCAFHKNPAQLDALVTAYRKTQPDDVRLIPWEVELRWLRGDFEGVVQLMASAGARLKVPYARFKADDCHVRSLIKLKRFDEAARAAEVIVAKQSGNQILLVLVRAAQGDVQKAIAAAQQMRPLRFLLSECYRDEELGPMLRSEAFRAFRDVLPEAPNNEAMFYSEFDD